MSRGKTIGVLGGMGPAATWAFCNSVLALTPAETEQEHLRLLVDNDPSVPDRHAAVSGDGPSPAPHLAQMAQSLEKAGAEVLCMACNTAHMYVDSIRAAITVPFIDMIDVTAQTTLEVVPGLSKVGLLATTTTIQVGLYQDRFNTHGVEVLTPMETDQLEVMEVVRASKRGRPGPAMEAKIERVAEKLYEAGAEVIIAGCTEIPLALHPSRVKVPLVDSSEVLAHSIVQAALHS